MISDGGPAFPCQVDEVLRYERKGMEVFKLSGGMSLRDWFAGKCLTGLMADPTIQGAEDRDLGNYANYCYRMADALIEERNIP